MKRALGARLSFAALFVVSFAALFAATGCSPGHGPPPPNTSTPLDPRVVLRPEGRPAGVVKVEVARTAEEQRRGLMFRDHLDDGRGMLFLFDHPHGLTFWMHNTYIPLDMVFITAGMRVAGVVESATPLTDDPRGIEGDAQYVLEVPGGWSAAHRIGPGTPVQFVDVDKEPSK